MSFHTLSDKKCYTQPRLSSYPRRNSEYWQAGFAQLLHAEVQTGVADKETAHSVNPNVTLNLINHLSWLAFELAVCS